MKKEIISAAGKIWKLLSERGDLNIESLPRLLKIKSVIVYQAIGWLAREDKVKYAKKGDKQFLKLVK